LTGRKGVVRHEHGAGVADMHGAAVYGGVAVCRLDEG